MKDPVQHSPNEIKLKVQDRQAILLKVLLLLGIVFAFALAASQLDLINRPKQIHTIYLLVALIAQAGNWLVTAWTWQVTIHSIGKTHIPLFECLAQVIMVLVGKYVPGKVWGMAMRAYTLESRGVSYNRCLQATYLEQILFAHTGVVLGFIALVVANNDLRLILPIFLALLASLFLAPRFHDQLLSQAVRFLQRYLFKNKNLNIQLGVSPLEYVKLACVYLFDWIMWGVILLCLYLTLFGEPLSLEMSALLLGANAIAVIVGFFAFFVPGGIGVREGVAVTILSTHMPMSDALLLMIVYRLWLILMEGFAGIIVFMRKDSSIET